MTNKDFPKVEIDDFHYSEGEFVYENQKYPVRDLIKAAKDLPTFEIPLAGISLSHKFGDGSVKSSLYHYKRIENADLDYAIIIDDEGYICDGWHRVAKAILKGHTTIKAKRLTIMPDRD